MYDGEMITTPQLISKLMHKGHPSGMKVSIHLTEFYSSNAFSGY
jgi:hypothetical protein